MFCCCLYLFPRYFPSHKTSKILRILRQGCEACGRDANENNHGIHQSEVMVGVGGIRLYWCSDRDGAKHGADTPQERSEVEQEKRWALASNHKNKRSESWFGECAGEVHWYDRKRHGEQWVTGPSDAKPVTKPRLSLIISLCMWTRPWKRNDEYASPRPHNVVPSLVKITTTDLRNTWKCLGSHDASLKLRNTIGLVALLN